MRSNWRWVLAIQSFSGFSHSGSDWKNAPGSRSDVDAIFYDTSGGLVPMCDDNLEPAICQFAGIAALMIDQMKRNGHGHGGVNLPARLRPDFIFSTLRATASDIRNRAGRVTPPQAIDRPNGFDFDTGFGYVDAVIAKIAHAGALLLPRPQTNGLLSKAPAALLMVPRFGRKHAC